MNREKRARLLVDLSPLSVATEEVAAPADMVAPDEIAHDGPSYFGELDLKGMGDLTRVKAIHGDTGVPIAYAVKSDGAGNLFFMFAPEPNATFALRASYFAGVTNGNSLSDTNLTNRMLLQHPDIYLYASLAESAGFLREDERVQLWEGILQQRLDSLEELMQNQQYGGSLSDAPRRTF